jgi:hypothetical protein
LNDVGSRSCRPLARRIDDGELRDDPVDVGFEPDRRELCDGRVVGESCGGEKLSEDGFLGGRPAAAQSEGC